MRREHLAFLACALPSVLVGCGTLLQEPGPAPVVLDVAPPAAWQAEGEERDATPIGWLGAFDDPALADLIAEAQESNRDLHAAAAGVEQAWALARKAGAALAPGLSAVAGAARTGGPERPEATTFDVALQARWEVDLWGRIRTGQNAAEASAQATEADYRHARKSLAAAVARAYFIGVEARLQRVAAADIVAALTRTAEIVAAQHEVGVAADQDLALIRSDVAAARERLAAAEGGGRDAIRALELLVGRYPAGALEVRDSLPAVPPPPPVGLPAELLERRPDLVAAERRVAAAMHSLDGARVARLPSISLTASGGGASNDLADILNPANVAWKAASSLLVPLLDGGAGEAEVDAALAARDRAAAAYAQAALAAFAEVEGALDHGVVLSRRDVELTDALREAETALRLAELRFREGEAALLDVLAVRQRAISARASLLTVKRERLTQYVNLNLALGGHWDTAL